MINLSFEQLVYAVLAFLVVTGLHGFWSAAAASLMGDSHPRYEGRMTLNPLPHLDLLALAAAVLTGVGWTRPMPLLPANQRLGLLGVAISVVLGLLLTVACTSALLLLRFPAITMLPSTPAAAAVAMLNTIGQMGIWFALVNIVPLPPLAAGAVLLGFVPNLRPPAERYSIAVSAVALVVMFVGVPQLLFNWAYVPLSHWLLQ